MMRNATPPPFRGREGFTLPELMVASALTAVIMTHIMAALITSQRLFEATVADLELSLHARALREKVLYNITPEDGGLMNVCQSELEVGNPNKGWGDSLKFKPKKGAGNRLALGKNKKLKADREVAEWLARGAPVIQSESLFQAVANNGTIVVNLDLAIPIAQRKYEQRHQAQAQIMNE